MLFGDRKLCAGLGLERAQNLSPSFQNGIGFPGDEESQRLIFAGHDFDESAGFFHDGRTGRERFFLAETVVVIVATFVSWHSEYLRNHFGIAIPLSNMMIVFRHFLVNESFIQAYLGDDG